MMEPREILQQYFDESLTRRAALTELEKQLKNDGSIIGKRESAKAKYAITLINRIVDYRLNNISIQDLCLNLRDVIIIFGNLNLPKDLMPAIKKQASEFGLYCSDERTVSYMQSLPLWLDSHEYLDQVYSLTSQIDDEDNSSVGDKILSEKTIFTRYKSYEQKLAIKTALMLPEGYTLLVSQPTGGGKSLVTQMLSACTDGLTLVIVPTVALTLDQYGSATRNLKDHSGILCYTGEQSTDEKINVIKSIQNGSVRLLFASPEAIIKNKKLYTLLGAASKHHFLKNVVIDEAHIVPDWGIFFRPDFQIFSVALKKWKIESDDTIRTYMLSATLSNDVVDTLFTLFGTEGKNVEVRCDSLREEPRFCFSSAKSIEDQINKTIEAIYKFPKPLVVYVLEPREAEEYKKHLEKLGFKNIPSFTGKTKDAKRKEILENWKNDQYDVVVATSAFGIGVDKSNVRTIVHSCVPENLSRFYQEVGRAGRDSLPSISVMIPFRSNKGEEGDTKRALSLVKSRVLTVPTMIERWKGMMSSVIMDGDICTVDTSSTPSTMSYQEAEYAGARNISWNINLLLFLYRTRYIDLLDTYYQMQNKAYLIKIKLLKPEILSNMTELAEELQNPRTAELDMQLNGYRVMRDLVQRPEAECWGHIFKELFPLAREVCNGCPKDPKGKPSSDAMYKLRNYPALHLEPAELNRRLERKMGSFGEMIIWPKSNDNLSEILSLLEKAEEWNIGSVVAPEKLARKFMFKGITLTYDEFYFAAEHTPYLMSEGVLCIFSEDQNTNYALWNSLEKLEPLNYPRILYCRRETIVPKYGKSIAQCSDGYCYSVDEL